MGAESAADITFEPQRAVARKATLEGVRGEVARLPTALGDRPGRLRPRLDRCCRRTPGTGDGTSRRAGKLASGRLGGGYRGPATATGRSGVCQAHARREGTRARRGKPRRI